jgi:hypothetical protein
VTHIEKWNKGKDYFHHFPGKRSKKKKVKAWQVISTNLTTEKSWSYVAHCFFQMLDLRSYGLWWMKASQRYKNVLFILVLKIVFQHLSITFRLYTHHWNTFSIIKLTVCYDLDQSCLSETRHHYSSYSHFSEKKNLKHAEIMYLFFLECELFVREGDFSAQQYPLTSYC